MLVDLIWNLDPVILTIGTFQLRWFILFLLTGVLLSRFLLFRNLKNGNFSSAEGNALFNYSLLGALIGARLFYFILFEPQLLVSNPLHVIVPFTFKGGLKLEGASEFSFTGGLIGLLVSLIIFSRVKKKPVLISLRNGIQVFIVSVAFISIGNFFQSENYGTPTDSPLGVVFVNRVEKKVMRAPCCVMRIPNGKNPLDSVIVKTGKVLAHQATGYSPIIIYSFFTEGASEMLVNEFLIGDVKAALYELPDLIFEPGDEPLHYTIFEEGKSKYTARIQSIGISRHPVQLYEAVGMLLIGLGWYIAQRRKSPNLSKGLLPYIIISAIAVIHFCLAFLASNKGIVINWLLLSADQLACIAIALIILMVGWKQRSTITP